MVLFNDGEIYLALTKDQLEQLENQHGLSVLIQADVLRNMDVWGLMLVIKTDPNVVGYRASGGKPEQLIHRDAVVLPFTDELEDKFAAEGFFLEHLRYIGFVMDGNDGPQFVLRPGVCKPIGNPRNPPPKR